MKRLLVLAALVLPVVAVACGGSKDTATNQPDSSGAPVTSAGMVVPNTFMTYEGRRYRLIETLQANLLDQREFQKVGASRQADIEFVGSLDVYRRAGDSEAVYTFTKASGSGEGGVPALWLRWLADN